MRIQLTNNFFLDEFACKCGCKGVYDLDGALVNGLQKLRDDILVHLNAREAARLGTQGVVMTARDISILVNSGTRCHKHHRQIYESRGQEVKWGSRHIRGKAADIFLNFKGRRLTWEPWLVDLARKYFQGIGMPSTRQWIHVDIRDSAAEWGYDE